MGWHSCSLKTRFGRTNRMGWHSCSLKARFGRTIRCDFFLRFRWKKTPPPIRPQLCIWLKLYFYNCRNAVGEKRRADQRHGGRADANVMALPWRAETVPSWREHFTKQQPSVEQSKKTVDWTNDMATVPAWREHHSKNVTPWREHLT